MTDFKKELEDIQAQIQEKKIEQAKLEQQLDDLTKEKDDIDAQLKELEISNVEELEEKIISLEKELTEGVEKCKKLLI